VTTNENYVRKFANTVPEEDGLYLAREKMNPRTFLAELKRRHVYRVAIAYAVVAWLLIQVATQVFPFFEIPNWVVRLVVLVSVLGFPISLIIAWAFEMTPQGMKREGAIAPNEYIPHWSTRKFAALIVTIAMFATGVLWFQLVRSKPTSPAQITAAAMPSQKSIAVLPLLNESGDPGDEYFSDGLSEELIAALAQVRGLKVIGRSSSFRFKDKKEESKAIGEKLGVSTLLEGTVRKQGDQVRIVAELINAADGSELWSRTFDRELKDIFAVQSEIAMAVATSLELTVLGANEKSAQNAATKSVEAHNAYLQGHFYFERRNLEDYRKSVGFFDQAIHLDPGYALAYAERSEAWAWIGDLSSEKQKEACRNRCREGRRDRPASRGSARGPGLGSLLYRVEICRRSGRTRTCAGAFAMEPDCQRFDGASSSLSWSISGGREAGPASD
jgi:TolB-like protein